MARTYRSTPTYVWGLRRRPRVRREAVELERARDDMNDIGVSARNRDERRERFIKRVQWCEARLSYYRGQAWWRLRGVLDPKLNTVPSQLKPRCFSEGGYWGWIFFHTKPGELIRTNWR
ncbi:hypothetical protein [Thioalkalivibrio thiocyanodenitrificans]|uniref:hypothetical protein n=1 Tax=Thioalkalivibrio thiocyanodenitrificans TaxID=243063 RepID=UPI0012EAD1C8|nr:hypothetical protein [Thioalkalivibrio thiocyanodenitrificans]